MLVQGATFIVHSDQSLVVDATVISEHEPKSERSTVIDTLILEPRTKGQNTGSIGFERYAIEAACSETVRHRTSPFTTAMCSRLHVLSHPSRSSRFPSSQSSAGSRRPSPHIHGLGNGLVRLNLADIGYGAQIGWLPDGEVELLEGSGVHPHIEWNRGAV